jgi:broad specificity phosphatase PhoE
MSRTLWIVRHANRQDFVDPEWHKTADRPHDPGLSPDGIEQAHRLGQRLAATDIQRIIASPFLRTVQTAHAIADAMDEPLFLEPGLGEWLNAEWFDGPPETLSTDQLVASFDRVVRTHPPCHTPSFPESREAMFDRIGSAVRCLVERYDEELLLVGHGATVQAVLIGLVGDDVPDGCPLASITKLVYRNGGWFIAMCNDTSHLDSADAADRFQ